MNIKDRQQYLETNVFPNFEDDSYIRNYFKERGQTESVIQDIIDNKNKVFNILRQWSLGDIEFTNDFLNRYTPKYKGRSLPFKNIGNTPQLESFHDPYNYKYFGASHGRTYREFLNDYQNQNLFPIDRFSKPFITSDQIATWDFNLGKWVITYKEGKEPINKESRNIHLSRILFDSRKNDNYFTTTHINQPFLVTDIIDFQNKKNDYYVQEASEIPLTAIGNKLYFSESDIDDKDSLKSSFQVTEEKKEVQIDTYTYTTAQGENVTLQANGKSEQEVFKEFKEQEKIIEVSESKIIPTTKITVYEIDNNGNLTNYVVQATFEDIQSLLREHKYIFEGEHRIPTLEEVQEHYNFVKESSNMFSGVTIGSIIAGALGLTFLMSTFDKRGRRK